MLDARPYQVKRFTGLGAATAGAADLVQSTAARYGVDPALALAVARQESGLNQSAKSSAGAIGVMQLMPGTAAGLGVNPYDMQQNIEGGVRYLSQMLTKFDGDVSLALAAYNAGPGAVQKYSGIPPYTETQNYVSRILASYGLSSEVSATTTPQTTQEWPYEAETGGNGYAEEPAEEESTDRTALLLLAATAVAGIAILS